MTQPDMSPIQKAQLADLKTKIANLTQSFAEVSVALMREVPEFIFVRDFLPLFSGQSGDYRDELLNTWYTISGGPYNEVRLIDAAGQGVAVVPPLFVRQISFPDSNNASRLIDVFEEAKQRSSLSPRFSDAFVGQQLNTHWTPMVDEKAQEVLTQKWKELLAKYAKGAPKPSATAAISSGESELDL